MIGKSFIPFLFVENFFGINAKDSDENKLPGELGDTSINVFSDPQGALGSRPGYAGLTTGSIGSATAWCGFHHFRKKTTKGDYYIGGASNGALYKFETNSYVTLATGLTIQADTRIRFAELDDLCIMAITGNPLKKFDGTTLTTLGGTLATADICYEKWRYMFLHSTVDPRLVYYCGSVGSAESGYTSFLNFDKESWEVNGICSQGDDMIISQFWGLWRVQYTADTPVFNMYKIPSKVGAISHDAMKELPDGRMIFPAPDFQVYIMDGDVLTPAGDNIRKFLKDGVNSRYQYCVAGLNLNRSQYWLSFTYVTGATQNDRTLVMDWNRPYTDKWGKRQYPWFIYSIGANCFAEAYVSGKAWLYHGGYTGKMYQDDYGTNDDGVAFVNSAVTKLHSFGDATLEKKFSKLFLMYVSKGSHNLVVSTMCDGNASTEKTILQAMQSGQGQNTLWDVSYWDVAYWTSESNIDVGRDIDRIGRTIKISMGTSGIDEAWNVLNYGVTAKALGRAIR